MSCKIACNVKKNSDTLTIAISVVPYDLLLDFYVQIEITIDFRPIFYEESKNRRCQIFLPRERGEIQDGGQGAAQFLIFAIPS